MSYPGSSSNQVGGASPAPSKIIQSTLNRIQMHIDETDRAAQRVRDLADSLFGHEAGPINHGRKAEYDGKVETVLPPLTHELSAMQLRLSESLSQLHEQLTRFEVL